MNLEGTNDDSVDHVQSSTIVSECPLSGTLYFAEMCPYVQSETQVLCLVFVCFLEGGGTESLFVAGPAWNS